MSLKSMIQADVRSVFLNLDEFAESVEVWTYYTSTDAPQLCTITAIVDLPDSTQEYRSGDRNLIRGIVYLPTDTITREQLLPNTVVTTQDGTEYTIRIVRLQLRGATYRIDSVGEGSEGMLPVRVVQGVERYSNPQELDPL